jgi:hypothetical protein
LEPKARKAGSVAPDFEHCDVHRQLTGRATWLLFSCQRIKDKFLSLPGLIA